MGDNSWASRAPLVKKETVDAVAEAIRRHCDEENIPTFLLELHGGEPLLFGIRRMKQMLQTMVDVVGIDRIRFSIQTNGLLLNEEWVDLFSEYNISVGISIDGPTNQNKHRIDKKGQGTLDRLLKTINQLKSSRPNFRFGVLSVFTNETDVVELIEWFPSIGVHSFDLLFPLGNYVTSPKSLGSKEAMLNKLINGFDHWVSRGESAPHIRLYETIIDGFLGHNVTLDAFGGDLSSLCVIETDGSIGLNDVVR
jgi:uncharacterized protein